MTTKHLKHLKQFWFGWKLDDIPRTPDGYFSPENQNVVNDVETAIDRINVLNGYILNALRAAKITVGNPPLTFTRIMLTAYAQPEPYFNPEPWLYVDVQFDPLELLNLPKDKNKVGELYLSFVEEALVRLESIDGYPVDVIRSACDEFRKNAYTYPFKAGERMIPGTRLKGQIGAAASPVGTIRYLTVRYRNKPLFQTIISETDKTDMYFSKHFAGFELEGTALTVVGGFEDILTGELIVPPVDIDLTKYPEVIELMREKGWYDE